MTEATTTSPETCAGTVGLATGPVSWGVDFADAAANPPWSTVLDEIQQSGLGALELGPIGYLPEDPTTLRAALATRSLLAVGSFLFDDLHDPDRRTEILMAAGRASRTIAAAKGATLVIIDRPGKERAATAGRGTDARRLEPREWAAMLDTIDRVAEIAREHGLRPVVHPHAGSYIEFEDEIERLLTDSELPLCLDTGHAVYAGLQPQTALVRYESRIAYIHLKDSSASVIAHARRQQLTFWEAIAAGVFCPLGRGAVDLGAVARALTETGYRGYATIEQDRVPGSGSALQDLRDGVAALHAAGIGVPAVTHD